MFTTFHLPTIGLMASLAVASLAAAGPAAAAPPTLVAFEHAGPNPTTDNGAKGDSTGDILTFSNDVFDAANVNRIGSSQGACVRTVVGVAWECHWSVILADGQVALEGPFYDSGNSVFAITGGTGAYSTAAGDLLVSPRSDATGSDFDFRFQ
jgi:hypothetical protein